MSIKVTTFDKLISMTLHDIVRFQISNYCFMEDVKISPNELTTLAYLSIWGEINFSDFCLQVRDEGIYGNPQTVRNFILKCIKSGLVLRKGKGLKTIVLQENIEVLSEGNIVINMKVYHAEKQESKVATTKDS